MADEPQVQVFLDDISDKPPVINDGKLVLVEAADTAVKFGKESGDPYINLQLHVVEDPEDEGAMMFDILTLPLQRKENESSKAYSKRTDRRCFRLKQACIGFGVKLGKNINILTETGRLALAEEFRGRRAWTRVKLDQDQRGNDISRPDSYYKESEKPVEP